MSNPGGLYTWLPSARQWLSQQAGLQPWGFYDNLQRAYGPSGCKKPPKTVHDVLPDTHSILMSTVPVSERGDSPPRHLNQLPECHPCTPLVCSASFWKKLFPVSDDCQAVDKIQDRGGVPAICLNSFDLNQENVAEENAAGPAIDLASQRKRFRP